MKKLDKLLLKILIFSLVLFTVSVFFSKKEKNTPKAIESALLNPKYINEVALIEIQSEKSKSNDFSGLGSSITLKKQGDFWLLSKSEGKGTNEIRTLADKKIVTSLIEKASEIRKLYQISSKESDFDRLGTSENTSTTISFLKNSDNMYTKIHFGHSNPLTNRTFVRSESSKITYETENNLSQYLTTDTNYWSEGRILPEIDNPTEIIFEKFSPTQGTQESISSSKLNEKTPNFTTKSNTLLSLRHGKIKSEGELSKDQNIVPKPISALTVYDGNGRITRIEFFEEEELSVKNETGEQENSKSYWYKKSIQPSPADSQENAFAFYSENAIYELSGWTYNKISSLF